MVVLVVLVVVATIYHGELPSSVVGVVVTLPNWSKLDPVGQDRLGWML